MAENKDIWDVIKGILKKNVLDPEDVYIVLLAGISDLKRIVEKESTGSNPALHGSPPISLSNGDYIELYTYQTDAAASKVLSNTNTPSFLCVMEQL
jgi:hypothetical protein